ncbi:hypothetical protein F8B43_4886 [Methylorubrum populi]|uniref:Uncharacterized protein n=1 Tax=Methylorubrum populi TaxID=223967 RepID=A0A833J2B5_9HYPH|nr:hypothetical protein F8B43_4886 [Methylorubrum populi]
MREIARVNPKCGRLPAFLSTAWLWAPKSNHYNIRSTP